MNAYPFSLFKRAGRTNYAVQFKDRKGNFLPAVSTGKANEREATQVAIKMYRLRFSMELEPKPEIEEPPKPAFFGVVQSLKNESEANALLLELKRAGWVRGFIAKDTPGAEEFCSFMHTFWDWDTSPYIEEKLRKKHGLHKRHCRLQGQAITLHWADIFKGRMLGEITPADIDAFIKHLGKKPLSAPRKNGILRAGFKALRWAFAKGMIERDPTRGHILFADEEGERNILTPAQTTEAFKIEWANWKAKLGNILAAVTGLRSGEILALRLRDLGENCIYINGSWNKVDKLKPTKNNKARTVEIPFPDLMKALVELGNSNPWGRGPDSFVFWSTTKSEQPMHGTVFLDCLRKALLATGFTSEEVKGYVFHGWRHFYTSYMINKLNKKLLKSQTGHKTDVMLAKYADHWIEGDRQQIQEAQTSTFAHLLPTFSSIPHNKFLRETA